MHPQPPRLYLDRVSHVSWKSLLNVMGVACFPMEAGILSTACPFHAIHPHEQALNLMPNGKYQCWRCGAHGDLFQYVLGKKYKDEKDLSKVCAFFERQFNISSYLAYPELYREK